MQYEDTVRIATPEGVEIELALAGIGSRLAARLIDHLIQAVLSFGAVITLAASVDEEGMAEAVVAVIAILLVFLVFWGYDVLFEAFNSGRTPGKRALGLRVVGERGEPISFPMAAARNILRLVDEYLTLWLGALISIVRSRRNQRLGDMAAGTIVVKERGEPVGVEAAVGLASLPHLDAARAWDTTQVDDDDLAAARRFLERRSQLDAIARRELARTLAQRLGPKVHAGDTSSIGDEQFVELLVAVKSGRP